MILTANLLVLKPQQVIHLFSKFLSIEDNHHFCQNPLT
ncbi:hypothetical protein COO91_00504 [Nostoc flagelliforme CCNUN1]|uniref:Uncharacterized protein n=1 Tax=Nostoc flagelliforme CCNUN1 TaxID=2038116 RepID=A0A2K8SIL0_9NOSO|nr:hypothetical protein COO91_00504 [Nostoc flagelliforme CCNUN1]